MRALLHRVIGHGWYPSRWIKDARGTRWEDVCSCGATRTRAAIDYHPEAAIGP